LTAFRSEKDQVVL